MRISERRAKELIEMLARRLHEIAHDGESHTPPDRFVDCRAPTCREAREVLQFWD